MSVLGILKQHCHSNRWKETVFIMTRCQNNCFLNIHLSKRIDRSMERKLHFIQLLLRQEVSILHCSIVMWKVFTMIMEWNLFQYSSLCITLYHCFNWMKKQNQVFFLTCSHRFWTLVLGSSLRVPSRKCWILTVVKFVCKWLYIQRKRKLNRNHNRTIQYQLFSAEHSILRESCRKKENNLIVVSKPEVCLQLAFTLA